MAIKLKPIEEQTIVITGASSGIGLATALAAGKQGAHVVLAARNEAALARIVRQIEADGGSAMYVAADVSRREDLEKVADAAVAQYGRIDTWVNDAGQGLWGKLTEVTDEDHRKLFDINFWGIVYGSTIAVKHLRENGGALINLGSEVSEAALPIQGMYATTKHAIKGFTDSLRLELIADKAPISVTLIRPAAIATPFPQNAKNYTGIEPKLPQPIYRPEDVARAILFAATHPKRDIHVGSGSKLMSAAAKLMPGWLDPAAGLMAKAQLGDGPAQERQDSLYQAGENGGRVYGDHAGQMVRPSLYTNVLVRPALSGTLLAAAGVAAGFLGLRAWKS